MANIDIIYLFPPPVLVTHTHTWAVGFFDFLAPVLEYVDLEPDPPALVRVFRDTGACGAWHISSFAIAI